MDIRARFCQHVRFQLSFYWIRINLIFSLSEWRLFRCGVHEELREFTQRRQPRLRQLRSGADLWGRGLLLRGVRQPAPATLQHVRYPVIVEKQRLRKRQWRRDIRLKRGIQLRYVGIIFRQIIKQEDPEAYCIDIVYDDCNSTAVPN